MQNQLVLKLLVSAIALAAATSASAAAVGTVSDAFVALTAQHATALHNGEVVTGPLASSQPMHVVVSLKLQNQDKLNRFLATASNSRTPVAQRSMTSAEFVAQYSPTQAQAQAVASYLHNAGFKNVIIAPNRQLVSANATADTVRAAFHTSFESARTTDGRVGYRNTGDVMLPSSLKDTVLAVLGLDTVHISHTFAQRKVATPVPLPNLPLGLSNTFVTTTAVGHTPTDFATIYGANKLKTASTVAVGIITEGSMANIVTDLNLFTDNAKPKLARVKTTTVVVDGGSTDITGDVEWDLDSQDIVGMSGGVKQIYFYATTGLTDAAITDDYNRAVTDNIVPLINVSLGECETDAQSAGVATSEDQIFKQAVAQGQTFSVSSGDSGANECSPVQYLQGLDPGTKPSWPASSQYVVSVGGTEVYTTGTTAWLSEIVWNNKSEYEGAGGGSPSQFEAMPSWQIGVGQNQGSVMRGVPDIAFDGSPDSGALIYSDGVAGTQVGGTSLSSPLFVGAWARTIANSTSRTTALKTPSANLPAHALPSRTLGFAAPLIYKMPTTAFQDITVGDNQGETSAPGWDYTSGFGSPIVNQMVRFIVAPTPGTLDAEFSFAQSTEANQTGGLKVSFTDASTDSGGSISNHYWDFGDTDASDATNPDHTYSASGTYNVTETVTDSATGATLTSDPQPVTVLSKEDSAVGRSPVAPPPAPPVPPAPPAPPVPPTPPLPI